MNLWIWNAVWLSVSAIFVLQIVLLRTRRAGPGISPKWVREQCSHTSRTGDYVRRGVRWHCNDCGQSLGLVPKGDVR